MRKIKSLIVGLVFAVSSFAVYNLATTTANAGDCSANSVIKCGVSSYPDLRNKYNADSTRGTKNIFSYFGISSTMVNSHKGSIPTGYVTKNGDVVANGKVVATGATTAGRQYIPGSTKRVVGGTTFYERKPGVSFRSNNLPAYVYLDQYGQFKGAVIKDCGNPVKATNKVVPKKIKVCDVTTRKIITINEADFNKTKHSTNLADCEPIKVCDLSTKKIISIYPSEFNKTKHSKNLEDCKVVEPKKNPAVDIVKTVNGAEHATVKVNEAFTYELVVKNTGDVDLVNVKVTDKQPADVKFVSADKGTIANGVYTYTVPTLKVGASETMKITAQATKSSMTGVKNTACVDTPTVPGGPDDCDDATIDTPKPVVVERCDLTTNKVVTITEEAAKDTDRYTTDLTKCKDIEVCEVETGKTVTVPQNEYDQNKDKYSTNPEDCEKIEVCVVDTKEVKTIRKSEYDSTTMTTDMSKCEATPTPPVENPKAPTEPAPEVPAELPQTGIAQFMSGTFGLGMLAAASYYYNGSKRAIADKLQ